MDEGEDRDGCAESSHRDQDADWREDSPSTFLGDGSLNEKVYLSQPRATKATCRLIKPVQLRLS